jgi:DNA invertase Pin-like site-specific DNA recombinase
MAAYCRVSTSQEEQLLSYENQVNFYKNYITSNPAYEFIRIYADEGISATNTKKRDEFNRMIKDCKTGKIDMIITKSISRFARNTLDCLNFVRELKEQGIGIIFEKENINTLDAKGEVLLTILSSLAQDESRSISENSTWGIKRRFEQGKVTVNYNKFLGYTRDEDGNLVVDKKQAKVVKRIYQEYLNGYTTQEIARRLTREGVKNGSDRTKWYDSNIKQILTNEKYKGDALLQKTYTIDFLNKKRTKNDGQVTQYYVEDSHDPIINKEIWECVQLEMIRRKEYLIEHGIKQYLCNPDSPFSGRIICGKCGKAYGRKAWDYYSENGPRYVWQCSERYKKKGIIGCDSCHVDEEKIKEAYIVAWNMLVKNRENYIFKWKQAAQGEDLLKAYKAKQFMGLIESTGMIEKIDNDFLLKTLENIKVYDKDVLIVRFLDGSEIECGGE